jgi:hypothetical protein
MMDQNRQIRLVIPSFFLLIVLFLDLFLSEGSIPDKDNSLITLITAAAASIPLGFGISAVAISICSMLGWYDVQVHRFNDLWNEIGMPGQPNLREMLYAVATFDHEIIPKSIHEWLLRRWNTFNTSISSITALILAHVVAVFKIGNQIFACKIILYSLLPTFILIMCLLNLAIQSRTQTREMLDFQVTRIRNRNETVGSSQ